MAKKTITWAFSPGQAHDLHMLQFPIMAGKSALENLSNARFEIVADVDKETLTFSLIIEDPEQGEVTATQVVLQPAQPRRVIVVPSNQGKVN